MNNPMSPGWGPCGLCSRNLPLMTPITSVVLPGSKRAVMTCKSCPVRDRELKRVGLEPEEKPEHPLVVSNPAEFAGAQLKTTGPVDKSDTPSKPVREQTGRRRTKKETSEPTEGKPEEGRSDSGSQLVHGESDEG